MQIVISKNIFISNSQRISYIFFNADKVSNVLYQTFLQVFFLS